jgi:hypothetical protein
MKYVREKIIVNDSVLYNFYEYFIKGNQRIESKLGHVLIFVLALW